MIKRYDAGLLGDGGGGDVEWWQDYLRVEIERCNDFHQAALSALEAENRRLREGLEAVRRLVHKALLHLEGGKDAAKTTT